MGAMPILPESLVMAAALPFSWPVGAQFFSAYRGSALKKRTKISDSVRPLDLRSMLSFQMAKAAPRIWSSEAGRVMPPTWLA